MPRTAGTALREALSARARTVGIAVVIFAAACALAASVRSFGPAVLLLPPSPTVAERDLRLPSSCLLPAGDGDKLVIAFQRVDRQLRVHCYTSEAPRWMRGLIR